MHRKYNGQDKTEQNGVLFREKKPSFGFMRNYQRTNKNPSKNNSNLKALCTTELEHSSSKSSAAQKATVISLPACCQTGKIENRNKRVHKMKTITSLQHIEFSSVGSYYVVNLETLGFKVQISTGKLFKLSLIHCLIEHGVRKAQLQGCSVLQGSSAHNTERNVGAR